MYTNIAAYFKQKDIHIKFLVDQWLASMQEASAGLDELPATTAHGLYVSTLALASHTKLAEAIAAGDLPAASKSTWEALHTARFYKAQTSYVVHSEGFANVVLATGAAQARFGAICSTSEAFLTPKVCFAGLEDVDGLCLGVIVSNVALAMVKVPVADAATTAPVSGATDAAAAKTARGLVVDAALLRAVLLKAAELGFVQELPTIIQAALTASKAAILPSVRLSTGPARINFLAHAPLRQSAPVLSKREFTTHGATRDVTTKKRKLADSDDEKSAAAPTAIDTKKPNVATGVEPSAATKNTAPCTADDVATLKADRAAALADAQRWKHAYEALSAKHQTATELWEQLQQTARASLDTQVGMSTTACLAAQQCAITYEHTSHQLLAANQALFQQVAGLQASLNVTQGYVMHLAASLQPQGAPAPHVAAAVQYSSAPDVDMSNFEDAAAPTTTPAPAPAPVPPPAGENVVAPSPARSRTARKRPIKKQN